MPSSERIIGFSTGAIAKGDYRRALGLLTKAGVSAVELSALREGELPDLVGSLPGLDLSAFHYVSIHAPAHFGELEERKIVQLLEVPASLRLPIVVHPDTLQSTGLWRQFGPLLLIENMDKRKSFGRTAPELNKWFEALPEAGLCFDVAHARQVDPSMVESAAILRQFQDRLREVHASGVTTLSTHAAISAAAHSAYSSLAGLIPESVPIILESPVPEALIQSEIDFARSAFSPWLLRLQTDVDDVFDLKVPILRKTQARNFLEILRMIHARLSDFETVVSQLPTGGSFARGDLLFSARLLYDRLSEQDRDLLRRHLLRQVKKIALEFPDLKRDYPEQFASVE